MKKIIAILFVVALAFSAQAQELDRFANIGVRSYETREHLLEKKLPPTLEQKFLPISNSSKAAFKPMDKLDTPEELQAELIRMRAKYAPFMRKLAPEIPSKRERTYLRSFQWKKGEEGDVKKFNEIAQGKGEWETVEVPHYGEPLGKKTTYYYKKIEVNQPKRDEALFLCFKGVDYIAKVFVNGVFVGSHEGFFAPFEFEISNYVNEGKNDLLIQVENDITTTGGNLGAGQKVIGDKIYGATGLGYDEPKQGWHHCPPAMGIFQDCYLETRNKLHINDLFVRPILQDSVIEAWVEVNNLRPDFEKLTFRMSVYGQNFQETIAKNVEVVPASTFVPGVGDLAKPTDNTQIALEAMPGYVNYYKVMLPMKNFKLWSPDTPWLYEFQLQLLDSEGEVSDTHTSEFGMRSFRMDTESKPKGKMYLNGEMIRLRGANTMGHLQNAVINKNWEQLRDDILLAKIANMNYLRMTQRPVQKEIYEYFDMLGLMHQSDLPLFGTLSRNKFTEAVKQAEELERLVRSHPSTIMVSYINERFPNGEGNPQRSFGTAEEYYKVFKAFDQAILLSNPDRVIKAGDGDYDPPSPGLPDSHCYNLWYNGHGLGIGEMYKGYWQKVKPGWLYACGEFGAEGLDPVKTMQKYYPKGWLPNSPYEKTDWTANQIAKAQTHRFHYMWYPTQNTLEDWVEASQDYQAEAIKFTTEAFRRDARMVSFAVHLFIDAWPAGWMKAIMDVDRNPKKAYFAYRDALKPLMVSLRTDRRKFFVGDSIQIEAWVANDLNKVPKGYTLRYQLERGKKVVFANQQLAEIVENAPHFNGFIAFEAPKVRTRTNYQLRLGLFDDKGKAVSEAVQEIEVFPRIPIAGTEVKILGEKDGTAAKLTNDLGLVTSREASTLLIDDYAKYAADSANIHQKVREGATVIFLEMPTGKHSIANTEVHIENTAMGEYYFSNPNSGHPLTQPFKDFDFRFWYEKETDRIAPLLTSYFKGEGWKPMLLSGEVNWVEDRGASLAAGELPYGKGKFYLVQLDLAGRVNENPTAKLFANALLKQNDK